jgi:fructose-bisphosphate aldolase class II
MPLVPTGDLVTAAAAGATAVAAFNVVTLEHAEAIVAGAERAGHPVILQVSQNAVRFHWQRLAPIAAAARSIAELAAVPVGLHLDHVESVELLHEAPGHGFGSVMFDASARPYAENLSATAAVVAFGHAHGLWVEGELGGVGGKPGSAHAPGARTDPDEAADYAAATGVDALAVAVGTSHAMVERTAALDHGLIARLRTAVPVPLVLHGSSGVPEGELRRAVGAGIAKVNIGTALNVAYTDAVRDALGADARLVDPRDYLAAARDAIADVVAYTVATLAAP